MSVSLCALSDVRTAMETKGSDTALDTLITTLIPLASQAILDRTERQFVNAGTATHRFTIRGLHVDFSPFDLQSATVVTLDPDSAAQVLSAHNDYELMPNGGGGFGVYTGMQLSLWLPLSTTKQQNFGFADVSVTGTWGFASVPDPVKQACIVAVRSWLRRDMDSYGQVMDNGMRVLQPQPFGTYKLPPASLALLDPYMRFPAGAALA